MVISLFFVSAPELIAMVNRSIEVDGCDDAFLEAYSLSQAKSVHGTQSPVWYGIESPASSVSQVVVDPEVDHAEGIGSSVPASPENKIKRYCYIFMFVKYALKKG